MDGRQVFPFIACAARRSQDVWINRRHSQYMIESTMGSERVAGMAGPRTWSVQSNQPTAEITR